MCDKTSEQHINVSTDVVLVINNWKKLPPRDD